MGIDIGTSSAKTAIFNEKGEMLSLASKPYYFETLKPGYAEQDPEVWWKAVVDTISESLKQFPGNCSEVKAVSFSGQMHGAVPLDVQGNVVRKAILHCDVRAGDIVESIVASDMDRSISEVTMNPVFPGFQMISLCWIRQHEPEIYEKIHTVVCPKDYVRFRMTGVLGTESTDASGTLLYDMRKEQWAPEVFKMADLDPLVVPQTIHNSCEVVSTVLPDVAELTGLSPKTLVVYGGADQAMHSLGNGVFTPGIMMATIGTSGQILTVTENPIHNDRLNTHTFRHVNDHTWYGLAAVLHAGSTLNWFRRNFAETSSYEELSQMASQVRPCAEGLVFFPCMGGERTPYLDSKTRGMFSGISMCHGRGHFARAIMEGVSFAIKTGIDTMEQLYGYSEKLICAGGGVKGRVWAQIQADIYGREIHISHILEQACLGAAIVAGIGAGEFLNLEEGCAAMVGNMDDVLSPIPENVKRYQEFYEKVYAGLYKQNQDIFHNMGSFSE
ncbi:MAG: xylulokinase [Lachnospiraceae bacterium]|nr:xylulokinase [Lachnospiraceae bacterium]